MYLAFNAYCFSGPKALNSLLVECISPVIKELRSEGLVDSFFYDRFDRRGPHIFGVASVCKETFEEVEYRIKNKVESYFADRRNMDQYPLDELMARHYGCEGKALCEIDRLAGLATDQTVLFCGHSNGSYPFSITKDMPGSAELWRLVDKTTSYTLQVLADERSPTSQALNWIATVDRSLYRYHMNAGDYYRYHAATLLTNLEEKLEENEQEIIESLPGMVAKNRAIFDKFFSREDIDTSWLSINQLVNLATNPNPAFHHWATLREVVHCTLKQFGLSINTQMPIILYGWLRALQQCEFGGWGAQP